MAENQGRQSQVLIDAENIMLERLLNLFPQNQLKATWPELSGQKKKIIETLVAERDYRAMSSFVSTQFQTCKQHVYLHTHPAAFQDLPETFFPDLAPMPRVAVPKIIPGSSQRTDVYLTEATYTVYLRDPFEELQVPHLWPVIVQIIDQFCLVRFVKLQRDLASDFRERHIKSESPPLNENDIREVVFGNPVIDGAGTPVNLNSAIKALAQKDMIDTDQVRLKNGNMTSTHELDAGKTIKKDLSLTQQQRMLDRPNILKIKAKINLSKWNIGIPHFFCFPTEGFVNFSTYSEHGETDHVLREILQNLR